MNTILLQPTDVLFFRDGRPMTGSLAGHGAAWPLPDVTNHALHAALHRAELDGVHAHRRGQNGKYSDAPDRRDRKFGSLVTAGPFPVQSRTGWFFPRPKDAQKAASVEVTLSPAASLPGQGETPWPGSSLPTPLKCAVGNTEPPNKAAGGEAWISTEAFKAYLRGDGRTFKPKNPCEHFLRDESIADREANLGIAIDPDTQTTGQGAAEGQIYTAHYLRLRDGFQLGLFGEAMDKVNGDRNEKRDLVQELLKSHPSQIVVGGQQRICTAELCSSCGNLPLPRGLSLATEFHQLSGKRFAVKWILLSPAIWPEMPAGEANRETTGERRFHPGGWLPNWVSPESGSVLLRTVTEAERARRRLLNYAGKGYSSEHESAPIAARLVAAIVPKPLVVTGWALPNPGDPERPAEGGAKATHLAVPAGAVYYFEAEPDPDGGPGNAIALARALNWHGDSDGTKIKNRRSTLLGEKGYGLGVCGTWKFFSDVR